MSTKEQEAICEMFDRIASTYDTVNRVLSFRQDIRWRTSIAHQLPRDVDLSVLDVATGTADLLITMCQLCQNITEAVGVDLSDNMLSFGRKKLASLGLASHVELKNANACELPFLDRSFDVVTIAFGIRNVSESKRALSEFARVLKNDGRLFVLEFSLPNNRLIRMLYLFYFRHILPLVGGLLSKDPDAYRYLNQSVEAFPKREAFKKALLDSGFSRVDMTSLTCGVATIYCARKI